MLARLLLRGFALQDDAALLATLKAVTAKAPFRHVVTPGGFRMSVAMTNCGALGWVHLASPRASMVSGRGSVEPLATMLASTAQLEQRIHRLSPATAGMTAKT